MIDKVLNEDEIHSLEGQYINVAVKALKEMKGRKTPRPDGLQTCFLHKYWNALGPKVISIALGIL